MGVVITFDPVAWALLFPQFSNLNSNQLTQVILPVAEQYSANDGSGPVCNPATQTQLLNLMVAHVAQLLFGSTLQPLSPLVGRISSATEGSVSVVTDFPETPTTAWYNQTQYGAAWLVMSARFITSGRDRKSVV